MTRSPQGHCEEREARRGNLYRTRNAPFYTEIAAPDVWGKLFEKSFPQTPFKNFQQWKQGNARL
jgi:hypothetical protein